MAAGQAERGVGEIRSHREFVRTMVQDDGHWNDRGVVLDAVRAEGQGTNVRLGAAQGRPRDRAGGRGAKAAVRLSSPLRTFCPTVSSYLAAARQNVQALGICIAGDSIGPRGRVRNLGIGEGGGKGCTCSRVCLRGDSEGAKIHYCAIRVYVLERNRPSTPNNDARRRKRRKLA